MQGPRCRAKRRGGRRRGCPSRSFSSSSSSKFTNVLAASVTNFILSSTKHVEVDYGPQVCAEGKNRDKPASSSSKFANVLETHKPASSSSKFANVLEASAADLIIPEHVEVDDWEAELKPKWIELVDGPFTKADQLCVDIRRLQQRCGCSDSTCDEIMSTFSKYLSLDADDFRSFDGKMQEMAGASVLRLNGCPECNCHVYLPDDEATTCPHVFDEGEKAGKARGDVCGHSRFDPNGQPWEASYVCMLCAFTSIFSHQFIIFSHTASLLLPDSDKIKGVVADQTI